MCGLSRGRVLGRRGFDNESDGNGKEGGQQRDMMLG